MSGGGGDSGLPGAGVPGRGRARGRARYDVLPSAIAEQLMGRGSGSRGAAVGVGDSSGLTSLADELDRMHKLSEGQNQRQRTLSSSASVASEMEFSKMQLQDDDTMSVTESEAEFELDRREEALKKEKINWDRQQAENNARLTTIEKKVESAFVPPTASVLTDRSSGSSKSCDDARSVCSSGTASCKSSNIDDRQTINKGFDKHGIKGSTREIDTNYYPMNGSPTFELLMYRGDTNPAEDNTNIKKSLFRQTESALGKFVFDGSIIYTTRVIPEKYFQSLTATRGDIPYQIIIQKVGSVDPEDPTFLQFYNIIMRKAMTLLGMEELGRNLYDRHAAIKFREDRLELWPGFITAIRNHENETLLCVEVTHKVLRAETVNDLIIKLSHVHQSRHEWEKAVRAEIVDSIVMTFYNRRTYKISDVDFGASPMSTFRGQDGSTQTYAEYYSRRYDLNLTEADLRQPMLVSTPKKRDINKGITGDIYLVPSLCHPTGLSDSMRKNFQLMTRLSKHLHMDPETRKKKLDEFMNKLRTDEKVQEEFKAWNVDFNAKAVTTTARVLDLQKINVGPEERGPIDPDNKGDWSRNMRNRQVLKAEDLRNWLAFVPDTNNKDFGNFLTVLKKMGAELGIRVYNPSSIVTYDPNRCDNATLDRLIRPHAANLDLVFFVLPNNTLRRYAEIKHYCTLVLGVPSQCFLARNLSDQKKLNSVASKVVIQMTAKLGGVPWSVKIPTESLMVLGFDVYHCSNRKGESAGALVGSTSPSLTSYYSLVSFHKDKSELAINLCVDFVEILKQYRNINNKLPTRIVMYRDGVGDGQINYVLQHEVEQMLLGIKDIYAGSGVKEPTLTFIIVTKRINTRAFIENRKNLPVGTVIDKRITLPNRYDFFLVSQDVRQGTVSPTSYNVVKDQSNMSADQMQLLSYKMCHLYFNWSGTVAVPAPCQYAHKLAYLTGVAVSDKPKANLNNKLWYL